MKILRFIASDTPLKEVVSEHVETKSVNRSLESGEDLPSFMTDEAEKAAAESESRLGKVIIYDSVDFINDFEIIPEEEGSAAQEYTTKKYYAAVTYDGSSKQTAQLNTYIQDHLATADEIELWNIFATKKDIGSTESKAISAVGVSDIKNFFTRENLESAELFTITK